jgi:hypothetical protein
MCNRHSFILTRAGKVHDGYGVTDSHTVIRELAGLSANDDTVNAYEWQPPKGWPDADYNLGLTKDFVVFETKSSHESAIERHIKALYQTIEAWNEGDKFRVPESITEWNGDLIIPKGATFTAPVLAEVAGFVYVQQGATFTAPVLAEVAGSVDVREGATFTAPVLAKAGSVYVQQGATFTAPVLAKAGSVDVQQGATFTAPVLAEVAGFVYVQQGATFTAPLLNKKG